MKLAAIKNKAVTSTITFADSGETLSITHNPAAFTPRLEEELTAGDKRSTRDLAVFLNAILVGWDLTDDDGVPYPLTVEALCGLPIEFLGRVVEQVNSDNNPNPTSSAPSGSFS